MGLLSRARNEYVSVRVRTHELRSKNRRRKTRGCRDWDVKKMREEISSDFSIIITPFEEDRIKTNLHVVV